MNIIRAKVTSKGQVTLPKPLRDALSIKEGDHVEFSVENERHASMVNLRSPGSSSGIMKHLAKKNPVTVEQMKEAVRDSIVKKYNHLKSGF